MKKIVGTVALLMVLPACAGSTTSVARPTLKVAFFEDGSFDGAQAHVAPAYQGMRLAFQIADTNPQLSVVLELDLFDNGGDAAKALDQAKEVVADPSYVAAVAAPFWSESTDVSQALSTAGIPTISLSMLGGEGGAGWFRMVATIGEEAQAVASSVRSASSRVCLFGDGSPYSDELGMGISSDLGNALRYRGSISDPTSIPAAIGIVRKKNCSAIVWTGLGTEGASIKVALSEANLGSLPFVAGDGTKDPAFLSIAGAAGDGTQVLCPCADLSTSTDMAAQRFIHDFQSSFGVAPGSFGVEGYDAGRLIVSALASEGNSREEILQAIQSRLPFSGLGGSYALTSTGELAPSSARMRTYVDRGMRWLPAESVAP